MGKGGSSSSESNATTETTTVTEDFQFTDANYGDGSQTSAKVGGSGNTVNIESIDRENFGLAVDLASLAISESINAVESAAKSAMNVLSSTQDESNELLQSVSERAIDKVSESRKSDATNVLSEAVKYGGIGLTILGVTYIIGRGKK